MADVVYGILYSNVHPVSGEDYQDVAPDDESFLRDVISPIYQVLLRVYASSSDYINYFLHRGSLKLNIWHELYI